MKYRNPPRHRSLPRSLAALLLLCAAPALASDTHYQGLLLGQRAMGLGGAFVSLADDPSASFYNPAGLGLMSQGSAGASLGIYGLERRSIEGGFGNPLQPIDLQQTSFPIVATTFAVMARFGASNDGPPRNAVGFSLFLPFSESTGFHRLVQRGGDASVYGMSESDRTLWVGPSYARRFGENAALGFSLFYDNRAYSRSTELSNFLLAPRAGQACANAPTACSLASSIDSMTGSLFLRVGAMWKVDAEWRFGVAFSSPTLHLHGGADVSSRRFAVVPGSTTVDYAVVGLTEQASYARRPFELRVGAAYEEAREFTLSMDVSLHGPLTYRRIETGAFIADPLYVNEVRRDTVVNVHLGGEYYPTPTLPLRFGLFTNFSSAPEIPDTTARPYLTRVHLFGGSLSVGYQGGGYGLDFGVTAQYGTGVGQAFDSQDQTVLRRAGVSQTLVYFFISGIGSAIARNINRILKNFE